MDGERFYLKRRAFLKAIGLLGMGTATAPFLPVEHAEAVLFGKHEYKVSRAKVAMGTYVSITAIHPSRDEAEEAISHAFEEIYHLCGILSRYDADSPVSCLNRDGIVRNGPQELHYLVASSKYYNELTHGAFDITVKPLLDLYEDSFKSDRQPDQYEIMNVLKRVGSDQLLVKNGEIQFLRPGMGITLDGVAKGYIVDKASELLSKKGIVNHLVNAGGDLRTSGVAANRRKWRIAIEDPTKRRQYPAIIQMNSGAIATSGNYEVFYDNEKLFHHIIDSRTGFSPEFSSSVTVKAPTVMNADALSTSVFVMQPKTGVVLINRLPDCECLILEDDNMITKSFGWNSWQEDFGNINS